MKIDQRLKPTRAQSARGFTLLELVVVVAILVILAGFILPKFDLFKLKANKGVAASNMTGISRIIQQYYAQNSVYPDRWDSLLTGAGALWVPGEPGAAPGLDPQLVGGPPIASPHKLVAGAPLIDTEARSLARIGIANVLDLDGASTDAPNQRFTTIRAINTGSVLATLNYTADDDAKAMVNHIYPQQADPANPIPPAGKRLVVFGFGSHTSAVGQVVQEVPFYPNTDQTQYYSRFLTVFEVDSGGGRAQLMAVVGADGDLISEEIADYYER